VPVNGAFIKSLPTLSGEVTDAAPGSPHWVEIMLKQVDGSYFNGDSFTGGTTTWFDTTFYTSSWTFAHANLTFTPDEQYLVIVKASDTAGNIQNVFTSGVSSHTFTYDTDEPNTGIGYPADDSYTTANLTLTNLTGTAVDPGSNPAGISVTNVKIRLSYIYGGDTYYSNGGASFSSTTAPGDAFLEATDISPWKRGILLWMIPRRQAGSRCPRRQP